MKSEDSGHTEIKNIIRERWNEHCIKYKTGIKECGRMVKGWETCSEEACTCLCFISNEMINYQAAL